MSSQIVRAAFAVAVILLGVIGGVMAYGLVGLFIGAVLLAVGYVLFMEWLNRPSKVKT